MESRTCSRLLQDEERKSMTGFPAWMSVPILRQLFSGEDGAIRQTDIVMLLTHAIRHTNTRPRISAPSMSARIRTRPDRTASVDRGSPSARRLCQRKHHLRQYRRLRHPRRPDRRKVFPGPCRRSRGQPVWSRRRRRRCRLGHQ
jgi:hypothetical protein